MGRDNGGVIGYPNEPTTTTARGMWGMNSIARRSIAQNDYRAWPSLADPYYASVSLLCHFEEMGRDTSTSYSYIKAKGNIKPKCASGTSAQTGLSSNIAKFGLRSGFIDSQNGNAFVAGQGLSELTLGTGDYTIEGWFYPFFNTIQCMYWDWRDGAYTAIVPALYMDTNAHMQYYLNGSSAITGATTVTATAWHHIALSRVSSVTRMYLDGVQQGSDLADSQNYRSCTTAVFGSGNDGAGYTSPHRGFIDEIRVTKGVGRYSDASFAVPTAPFPDY